MIHGKAEIGFISSALSGLAAIAQGHPQKIRRGNQASLEAAQVQSMVDEPMANAESLEARAKRTRAEATTRLITIGAVAVAVVFLFGSVKGFR